MARSLILIWPYLIQRTVGSSAVTYVVHRTATAYAETFTAEQSNRRFLAFTDPRPELFVIPIHESPHGVGFGALESIFADWF